MAVTFEPGRDGEGKTGLWVSYETSSGGRSLRTIRLHLPTSSALCDRACADLRRLAAQGRLSLGAFRGHLVVDGVRFGTYGARVGESEGFLNVFERMALERAIGDLGPMSAESPVLRPLEEVELVRATDGHVWLRSGDRIALRTRYPSESEADAEQMTEQMAGVLRSGRVEASLGLDAFDQRGYCVQVHDLPGVMGRYGWPMGWTLDQAIGVARALKALFRGAAKGFGQTRATESPPGLLSGSWVDGFFKSEVKKDPSTRFDREPLV